MHRFVFACVAMAALTYAVPASAHGCHSAWQQSVREGWHGHSKSCEPRRGLGVSERGKARVKRQAA